VSLMADETKARRRRSFTDEFRADAVRLPTLHPGIPPCFGSLACLEPGGADTGPLLP